MDFLLGAGLAALTKVGLDALGVSIEGIVGNEAHELFRHFRVQITARLKTGEWELPANHDLRQAIEGSLRDASHFLAQCLAAQHAPQRPAWQSCATLGRAESC